MKTPTKENLAKMTKKEKWEWLEKWFASVTEPGHKSDNGKPTKR